MPPPEQWFYHDIALENLLILMAHVFKKAKPGWFERIKEEFYTVMNVADVKLQEYYWKRIASCFENDVHHFQ